MHAYHGASRYFNRFDLAFLGEGEGANLLARGINLATNPAVADRYRERLAVPGSDFTDASVHTDAGTLTGDEASEAIAALEAYQAAEEGTVEWRKASMALQVFGLSGKEAPSYGVVYDCIVPDRDCYLVWEGAAEAQPFVLADLVRELYDEDALEEVYEEAAEESPLGCSQDHFDEVFDKALVQGVGETSEELEDIAPGYDWNRLHSVIRDNCPNLVMDADEEVGRGLYSSLAHSLGSDEAAAEWLSQRGIKGLVTSKEFTGFDGPCEIIVVWSPDDVKIDHTMSPEEIDQVSSQLVKEAGTSRDSMQRGGWERAPSM